MNEEDTFNRLRQTPFADLMTALSILTYAGSMFVYENYSEYHVNFLRSHGWSELEFKDAFIQLRISELTLCKIQEYSWWPLWLEHRNDLRNAKN